MATLEDVLLPDVGDFADVEILEVLVAPGDRIEPEQSLLTLESDKASMDIPAPMAGVVREVKVAVGDRINQGTLLMTVETDGAAAKADGDPPPASPAEPAPAAAPQPPEAPEPQAALKALPESSAPAAERSIEMRLPDIGDFKDIPVIEVLVGVGDSVAEEQSVLTLESDKATMEIPTPEAGVVASIAVAAGDTLNQGDLILTLRAAAGADTDHGIGAPSAEEAEQSPGPAASTKPEARQAGRAPGEVEQRRAPILPRPQDMAAIASGRTPHASPAVRRFARELGVDLARVKGSGRKDRIVKDDVQAYVKRTLSAGAAPAAPSGGAPFQLPTAPQVDFSKFGPVQTQPLPRIRRISGSHLHRCWLSVPHVTQFDAADITELEAFRKAQKADAEKAGARLTFMPFLLKAIAGALTQMPTLKASLSPDGESLVMKDYTHIGVAVDTPNGLVVPVIRDVDKKGVFDLARELMAVSAKARDGKLLPGDMQGGVFSVSSLGGIGGTAFTPIVNAPEVAILGVSRAEMRPVWDGSAFQPRLMLPLSLSYDHRVVDGADGVRFTTLLASLLTDIRRLLL